MQKLLEQLLKQLKKKLRSLNKAPQPILERRTTMEENFYNLQLMNGQTILDGREQALNNDRYNRVELYDIEIDPNKFYMASIIDEDITMITSIYIEEIIYEYNLY